tara:strand:+ start:7060 stop:7779 length:720 start_codon:yes stop_codon:yes gene_type:complete
MIYEFSNFVDNYSNADGESKERMAISQFSKILGQSPKTIEVAIADADIPVRENASMPEMIEIIKANVGNKKLKYHLGTLIVAQAQAEGENLNLFGKKADGTKRGGTKLFSTIGGWFKKKGATSPVDGTTPTTGGTEKKGWFKSLFSSNKDAQGNKQPSKFGSWFSKNSETIGNVGGSLLGGLFGSKGSDNANQQSEYYAGQNQPAPQGQGNRSGMGKKILIGVAGLGVIGLIIYLVRKK